MEPDNRIQALYKQAELQAESTFRITIPIARYFRSLQTMDQMQRVKTEEKQFEHAYLIQVKMSIIFIKYLKTHPEYAQFARANTTEVGRARKLCSDSLTYAESVKKQLSIIYEAEYKKHLAEEERKRHEEEAERAKIEMWEIEKERRKLEEESESEKRKLQEAADMAKRQNNEIERQKMISIYGDPDKIFDQNVFPEPSAPPAYDYQSSPSNNNVLSGPVVPPRNSKPAMVSGQLKIIGSEKRTVSSKLTTVSVPYSLSTQFLKVSSANNLKNLETCGILFGSLSGNEIKITHCLVPKQTGTHDSCTTTNEEQILEFQEENPSSLMLGWIHTHPGYNSFLSSVDLHNHYLYQSMLPESIAVVVSPKFNETGTFHLTEEGYRVIGSCKQTGFHPHQKNPPLFMAAPHVQYCNAHISIVDRR